MAFAEIRQANLLWRQSSINFVPCVFLCYLCVGLHVNLNYFGSASVGSCSFLFTYYFAIFVALLILSSDCSLCFSSYLSLPAL